jgi:hypothetical protein
MSEYDPVFTARDPDDPDDPRAAGDLEAVRAQFSAAGRPYLRSPISWLGWALVLPAAALTHESVTRRFGLQGVVLLWSGAILAGGLVEMSTIFRARGRSRWTRSTPLAGWVFRIQGNLSVVAMVLSAVLLWEGLGWMLPGLWMLVVGHSFVMLGGVAFRSFRWYGGAYQVGGILALWPGNPSLLILAVVAGLANLWLAWKVWKA